jgi:peptidoglycan/xylan/chitin deacetylase (PgdA/CDA1 family)
MQGRRILRYKLTRPLVSFTFDDCPKSAVDNGLNKLEAEGWRGTVYISSGLLGTTNHHGLQMSGEDVKAAHDRGHEIGGHGYSHIDATDTDFDLFIEDENRNRAALAGLGLPPCRTFAYPFGQTHRALKTRLAKDYDGLRGITSGPMINQADLNQIRSTPLFTGQDFTKALAQINALKHAPAWITLFTHDITNAPTAWGCTPAQMDAAIAAVKDAGADVLPIASAIDLLKANS